MDITALPGCQVSALNYPPVYGLTAPKYPPGSPLGYPTPAPPCLGCPGGPGGWHGHGPMHARALSVEGKGRVLGLSWGLSRAAVQVESMQHARVPRGVYKWAMQRARADIQLRCIEVYTYMVNIGTLLHGCTVRIACTTTKSVRFLHARTRTQANSHENTWIVHAT